MHRKLKNNELGRLSQEEFKKAGKINVTVVLDNIRSQHNIGAAFRTSDSFLIEKIILCGCCATPPTAEIHKSALGAEFSVDWEYIKETTDAVAALKGAGYTIISIEQEVVDMSHAVIEIPQFGTKHSLNISVSLGIVLWEFCKVLKIRGGH